MLQRIIRGRTAVLLLMIVVFAGCRVGKNYEQPALTLPERFNGVAYSDTASVADLKWKTFFTDAASRPVDSSTFHLSPNLKP